MTRFSKAPYPLTIVEDRYSGTYSGAQYLAFNMYASAVAELPIDEDDVSCVNFWDGSDKLHPIDDYTIGRGDTPDKALGDLIGQLERKDKHGHK